MNRYLVNFLVIFVFGAIDCGYGAGAQTTRKAGEKTGTKTTGTKVEIDCPAALTNADGSIADCPDTGCGPSLDPNLNRQKNMDKDHDAPVDKDLSF